ncbi:MAG: ubiquinol-cytochrome c reductase iron-sulfur subunit [Dehalococcoidia bacterium]|nr:ubiquinol-cytochrome c reductase iron-sulfur subunit [Dehalococcoidia bacterium]MCA9824155.1 ubiquinol-cytochrome c reductase iron-sulfur subunit [Dehalococcoidia bacterium]MCA9846182.1 ubiquinol-cytochrome c reductase iron-sulfur subunit [Dehalococcoidia bacterium]MCA9855116.1 ubiquinol-cytochrome c reductase iron-sulfur subunit [Dehalococcoidia bacterium]
MTQAQQTAGTGRVERVRQQEARRIARRSFLRVSVFAGLTLFTGAMLASFLGFFNRRKPTGFGAPVNVPTQLIPAQGAEPSRIPEGKAWLVNLQGSQGDVFNTGATGGILALYWKCPHLGCTVPWLPDFNGSIVGHPGIVGWFRCPCHGSTYSRAGVRVFGPAPRSMDTFEVTTNPDGSLTVNTGAITSGAADPPNPLRSIRYSG